jgi:hypothetical protein
MAERTPQAALREYLSSLQRAVSRLSPAVFVVPAGGFAPSGLTRVLSLSGRSVRLVGETEVRLVVQDRYRLAERSEPRGRWQVRQYCYVYALDDSNGREILAYHWRPEGVSHVTTPHVHLGAGAGRLRAELTTAHLPTGTVSSQALLRLAIEGFGIRPRRPDWAEILVEPPRPAGNE